LLQNLDFYWNLTRPALHKDIINKYAAVYKFDPLFVMALVKVESRFAETAHSHRGAVGLMQLMPTTALDMAKRLGEKVTLAALNRPETNIRLGFHYLSLLRTEFKDDTVALLAAYNAGPANVRTWMKAGPLMLTTIPYLETRLFIEKVLNTYAWLKRFQKIKIFFRV